MAVTVTPINLGSGVNTPGSENLYEAFQKVNANEAAIADALNAAATGVTAGSRTASYTLAASDAGTVVEMNAAGANTVTVPPNSAVPFAVGTVIEVCQVGAGTTTIAAGSGVTLRSAATLALRVQWSSVSLRKRATNEWVVAGDLA